MRATPYLRFAAILALSGALLPALPLAPHAATAAEPAAKPAEPAQLDVVTFRNGRVVEGSVLSDDGVTVRMRVVVAGIATETTYAKADILNITKAPKPVEAPKPAVAAPAANSSTSAPAAAPTTAPADAGSTARIVHLNLKGVLGLDVSQTPIKRALDDAATHDPDAIIVQIDSTQDERVGFNGLFRAESILPVFEEAIAEGQRIVFWVKSAQVGAAFLPFVSREIYFMPEGRMGGIGTLQDFNIGDKRVNEKQISLRLGHAEGVAIAGGYAPELVRAMARADYWLSVKFEGGEPVYKCALTPPPETDAAEGWILLSDNGDGQTKDKIEDEVRGVANDVLNLNAEWAQRLRVSKGTAADLDSLVFMMGLGSSHTKLDTRGQKILDEWSSRVKEARDSIRRLRERYENLQQKPDEQPETFVGRKMSALREIRANFSTYEEVFDPEGEQRAQVDLAIEQLKIELQNIAKQRKQQR